MSLKFLNECTVFLVFLYFCFHLHICLLTAAIMLFCLGLLIHIWYYCQFNISIYMKFYIFKYINIFIFIFSLTTSLFWFLNCILLFNTVSNFNHKWWWTLTNIYFFILTVHWWIWNFIKMEFIWLCRGCFFVKILAIFSQIHVTCFWSVIFMQIFL